MLEKIGEGDFGIVYAMGDRVIKKYRVAGCIDHLILADLQATGCVPRLFKYQTDRYVVMERIGGETLDEVNPFDVIGETWEQGLRDVLHKIVAAGYLPTDLSFENVMLTFAWRV
ncbi:hypothetical protein PP175_29170 (plasmid) [Aneurinibacillus sp. Ricciae_BoGa-3]|uniref:hypothetical protein n=1 Tax=Aneurinibacillus sp. Ricciae_BoGa-3 TaxID=3022697 RepID=UPI002340DD5D|nr:hypothetical protein [Aneurinibacillus sp. Ricciae_BoGa-3]WCK57264.1 hypothetical protein PP175_29170 [Aneurinibacillus sp. Ricciae_BoGa-3]